MKQRNTLFVSVVFLMLGLTAQVALAGGYRHGRTYAVTITNITRGQIISPPVVISHKWGFRLFELGEPASDQLFPLAEDADLEPLIDHVSRLSSVIDYTVASGPLMPGSSVTLKVSVKGRYRYIWVAGMLVTTNDAFFAVNGEWVSPFGKVSVHAEAYDAGSEANNESCDSIPGPPCNNPFVRAEEGAEGYVHIHAGIHGVEVDDGDMVVDPENHDWRNPVALVTIRPVR